MSKKKHKRLNSTRINLSKALQIPLPAEIDIPIMVDMTGLYAITSELNTLKETIEKLRSGAEDNKKNVALPSSSDLKAFAIIATNTWRAKNKMLDSDTGEAKNDMKSVFRHIEAIYESLTQLGIETIDPIGRVYDSGMALKVLSFEPTPDLLNEEIKETIKPSVAWRNHLIQIGEVIVGTPQMK